MPLRVPEHRIPPRLYRSRRIEWLIAHRDLWSGLRRLHLIHSEQLLKRWRQIVTLMRAEGLISPATHWQDVNLVNLIADARKEIRASAHVRGNGNRSGCSATVSPTAERFLNRSSTVA